MLDLPVCLSPIISSLCPLPIGIILSIASIPVCKGLLTFARSIMGGAGFSIGLTLSKCKISLPSTGFPRGFTTLPKRVSPTGTSTILPVHLTVTPYSMFLSAVISIAFTESDIRFIATA